MDISIQTKRGKRLVFEFGFTTPWRESMYWFSLVTEHFSDTGEIEYATLHKSFFKHPKFWFKP